MKNKGKKLNIFKNLDCISKQGHEKIYIYLRKQDQNNLKNTIFKILENNFIDPTYHKTNLKIGTEKGSCKNFNQGIGYLNEN